MLAFITLKLPRNTRKTARGANRFLGRLEVRAATFALLRSLLFRRPGLGIAKFSRITAISVNAVPRSGADNAPSLDETLLNHPGLKGNPDLIPEKIGTLDAQISRRTNRVQARVDCCYSRQTDLVIQNGVKFPAVYYNHAAPIDFHGTEEDGVFLYQVNDSGTGTKNLSPGPSPLAKAGAGYRSANGGTISVFDACQSRIAGDEAQSVRRAPPSGLGTGSRRTPFCACSHEETLSAPARCDLLKHWLRKHLLKDDTRGFALGLDGDILLNKPVWLPALETNQANTIPVIRGRTALPGVELWQKQNS